MERGLAGASWRQVCVADTGGTGGEGGTSTTASRHRRGRAKCAGASKCDCGDEADAGKRGSGSWDLGAGISCLPQATQPVSLRLVPIAQPHEC